jgi:hypothetical protein
MPKGVAAAFNNMSQCLPSVVTNYNNSSLRYSNLYSLLRPCQNSPAFHCISKFTVFCALCSTRLWQISTRRLQSLRDGAEQVWASPYLIHHILLQRLRLVALKDRASFQVTGIISPPSTLSPLAALSHHL